VLRATELAKQAIRASAHFQREVEEEERCFKQLSVWLHYGASINLRSRPCACAPHSGRVLTR